MFSTLQYDTYCIDDFMSKDTVYSIYSIIHILVYKYIIE
jgi:hypothetical protein